MTKTYAEKLRDPRWQKKRLERLEASAFSCDQCGNDKNTLHVHHNQYFKGREPWEYDAEQLSTLCENCHEASHAEEDPLLVQVSYAGKKGARNRENVACLVGGFLDRGAQGGSPEAYVGGLLAGFLDDQSILQDGLGAIELLEVLKKAEEDPTGFAGVLRGFAGLKRSEKKETL